MLNIKKISKNFEQLVYSDIQCANQQNDYQSKKTYTLSKHNEFDTIIIGSGYGGSIAAHHLGIKKEQDPDLRVAVLERGKEYRAGEFPNKPADLPKHIRASTLGKVSGERLGLYDIKRSPEITNIVANGLGGGSLINAGVMEPVPEQQLKIFPRKLQEYLGDIANYDYVLYDLLDAQEGAKLNFTELKRNKVMQSIANNAKAIPNIDLEESRVSNLTISTSQSNKKGGTFTNKRGVTRQPCQMCGSCATGCNFNSKISLDTNLLFSAAKRGIELYTGATVLKIDHVSEDEIIVYVTFTDTDICYKEQKIIVIKTKNIILSAGTFGSPEILLKSEGFKDGLSDKVGANFSGNGDAVVFLKSTEKSQVFYNYDQDLDKQNIGPTNTHIIRVVSEGQHYTIEDIAPAQSLTPILREAISTYKTIDDISDINKKTNNAIKQKTDLKSFDHYLPIAIMSDDQARGTLILNKDNHDNINNEGSLYVFWPRINNHHLFEKHIHLLQKLVSKEHPDTHNIGKIYKNPAWKPIRKELANAFNLDVTGPVLSVHPLGGCVIAERSSKGVVNEFGQLFKANSAGVYSNMLILDGSIIPGSLAINPALTIATIAHRAMLHYVSDNNINNQQGNRQLKQTSNKHNETVTLHCYRSSQELIEDVSKPYQTEIIIKEKLSGKINISNDDYICEIIIESQKIKIADLICGKEQKKIRINENTSSFCIKKDSETLISGKLNKDSYITSIIRDKNRHSPSYKKIKSFYSWLIHRGAKEIKEIIHKRKSKENNIANLVKIYSKLFYHTDSLFKIEYNLCADMVKPVNNSGEKNIFKDLPNKFKIEGVKLIAYQSKPNPIEQLSSIYIYRFADLINLKYPNIQGIQKARKTQNNYLKLDLDFYLELSKIHEENIVKNFLEITNQNNLIDSASDMLFLLNYIFRILISSQFFVFKKSDISKKITYPSRKSQQLILNRLSIFKKEIVPSIHKINLGTSYINVKGDEIPIPITILLTRYKPLKDSALPPILFIHGYSSGSTTFTHPSIKNNAALYFYKRGYDAWVVDLRTSNALPRTAFMKWGLEQVAIEDIPAAVNYIYAHTERKVNIFAHCIGSAMLSIALLKKIETHEQFYLARQSMKEQIDKIVTSQVSAFTKYSPINLYRMYLLWPVYHLFPQFISYDYFTDEPNAVVQQIIDRLLSIFSYSYSDHNYENCLFKNTFYYRTRRRMDALYGQTFEIKNISSAVLKNIDDIFGIVNLQLLSEIIPFAKNGVISDKNGNPYITRSIDGKIEWPYKTLHIHGELNGLADKSTIDGINKMFGENNIQTYLFKDHGHQDTLIGKNNKIVFKKILDFLRGDN